MRGLSVAFAVLLALVSLSALAHSGETDKKGCHHDRRNGIYHCH